jgi:DNA end-binding protein Ku
MPRALASLTISFGLVAIPVKLYSATRSAGTLRFNLLHAKDGSRLRQQYVCEKEDVVVGRDEIVKGLEFSKAAT